MMQTMKKLTDAVSVRLEKIEGAVNVTASGGKAVSVTNRLKLFNGYTVANGAGAKAYLSVDDSMVIAMEENSEITIATGADGKKLEVKLLGEQAQLSAAGSLSKDENGNIKVSTMVTGIRG